MTKANHLAEMQLDEIPADTKLKLLPDLSSVFKKMSLIERLEKELIKTNHPGIGAYLLKAIQDKKTSDNLVLKTVKEMAQDNLPAMQKLIGSELCNEILNL
jgi:hypothetical protein